MPEGFYGSVLGTKTANFIPPPVPGLEVSAPKPKVLKQDANSFKARAPISGYLNILTNALGFRNNFAKDHLRPYKHMDASPNPFYDLGVVGPYVERMKQVRKGTSLENPFK